MSDALSRVVELVRRETGIVVKDPQHASLVAALGRLGPGMDPERFLSEVGAQPGPSPLVSRLVDEITIQETYFLREPHDLQAIDWPALAADRAARGSDTVRVWVSACATGEEAYTFAILASEALGSARPPVSILGTDISTAALETAADGRYSGRSLRNLPADTLERHFVNEGGTYRVREGIRSLVRFRRHNLVSDLSPPPGEVPFDLVACRNVLIYFDRPTVESVIGSLESAIGRTGQLILGVADRLPGTTGRLDRIQTRDLRADRAVREYPQASEGRAKTPPRPLRRPLGLEAPLDRPGEEVLADALRAADSGDLDVAIATASGVLEEDALNADAYFVRGLAELGAGDSRAAVTSFRRALYVDPSFGLAAFKLGRAYDASGERAAAQRAYERALRALDPEDERHRLILDQVDLGDVAAACRMRLRADVGAGSR